MPNYRIIPLKKRNQKDKEYSDLVCKELSEIRRDKIPSTTIQSENTSKILNMSEEECENRRKQNNDINFWLDLKERSKAAAPWTCERSIAPDQYSHLEAIRRRPKNSIGQSELSSTSIERKELARQAFTCTPPHELSEHQKQRLINLGKINELIELPEEYRWKELNFFQAMWHKLKGGKIKQEEKK